MTNEALFVLKTALETVVGWFNDCLNAVEGADYVVAVIFMVLAVQCILLPALGNRGSDTATKREEKGGEE